MALPVGVSFSSEIGYDLHASVSSIFSEDSCLLPRRAIGIPPGSSSSMATLDEFQPGDMMVLKESLAIDQDDCENLEFFAASRRRRRRV